MSWQLGLLNLVLRYREKPYLSREQDFGRARARMEREASVFPMPAGARFDEVTIADGAIPALRLEAPDAKDLILWLHGGAYAIGSPRTHAAMVAALAGRAGTGAVLPDYRLAPENPFPAAVDDAMASYRGMLDDGLPASRLVIGGDSAGGGLALAVLHLVLEAGLPIPAGLVLFSPWSDLTLTSDSLRTLARRDVLLPAERVAELRDHYVDADKAGDPRASPLFGAFAGGPPVFVQASRAEILLDDTLRLVDRLEADGVAVTSDLWDRTPHVWQIYQGRLPEADAALDRAAAFIRGVLRA